MTKQAISSQWLYRACCIALTVTAMTFAIRAGILSQLGADYGLSDSQLGWINAMAFLGFPLATLAGGLIYNRVGPGRLLLVAFAGHLIGLGLTITASGFWSLLISTFFIGLANGAVEAGGNPLVAQMFPDNKAKMLNRFHVWFPGGILIGALISKWMTDSQWPWQAQIAVMLLPTLVYGVILLNSRVKWSSADNTLGNIKQLLSPLFLFLLLCMTLTATTELGTQQWIDRILGASGASPMLILAVMTGIMMVGRYHCGPLLKSLAPSGVLFFSAVFAAAGIYTMSLVTGIWVYFGAVLFAMGVTCFWPTMLGYVAQHLPQTGALGLSVIGGAGMFAVSMWQPVIGSWIDSATVQAQSFNLTETQAALYAGQAVLFKLGIFPLVLMVAFGALFMLVDLSPRNISLRRTQGGKP